MRIEAKVVPMRNGFHEHFCPRTLPRSLSAGKGRELTGFARSTVQFTSGKNEDISSAGNAMAYFHAVITISFSSPARHQIFSAVTTTSPL